MRVQAIALLVGSHGCNHEVVGTSHFYHFLFFKKKFTQF